MEKPEVRYNEIIQNDLNFFYQIMVIFFKSNQLAFGIDFGFFRNRTKNYRVLIIVATYILFSLNSFLFCSHYDGSYTLKDSPVWSGLVQYFLSVTILLMFKNGTTFYDFLREVKKIDTKLRIDSNVFKFERKFVITTTIMYLWRIIIIFVFCTDKPLFCLKPLWINIQMIGLFQSTDIMMITQTFVFYSINWRLSELLHSLKHKDFNSYLKLFKFIVDMTEKYKIAYDGVFVFAVLFTVPQTMFVITDSITGIGLEHRSYFRPQYFVALQSLLLLFGPAICGGMLAATVQKIKENLHNSLIIETDSVKCKEIHKFIQYIEARPMKFYVWGLLPLNANFLSIVLNFCITYLIVIVQFIFK